MRVLNNNIINIILEPLYVATNYKTTFSQPYPGYTGVVFDSSVNIQTGEVKATSAIINGNVSSSATVFAAGIQSTGAGQFGGQVTVTGTVSSSLGFQTAGVSTFGVGVSGGSYKSDENCERIKLSKVLNDLGMKVAAVSILCQDPRVFFAMEQSGTPCPFEGKIGSEATAQWMKYDKLRPDYNQYVDKLKVVEDARKAEEAKKQENTPEKK